MATDQETHAGAAGATNLDERALANLEPAEREAILGAEHGPEELAALRAVAGEVAAPAAAVPDAIGAGASLAPLYQADLPPDFDARVAKLGADREDLVARFRSGVIDVDVYQTEADKLNEQREELGRLKLKAELAQEMTLQSAGRAWQGEINRLFASAARDGIDYQKDEARRADLDTFVKALASRTDTVDWPMSRFLDEAHKRVTAMHGPATHPAPASPPTPAPASSRVTAAPHVAPTDSGGARERDEMPVVSRESLPSGQFDTIDSLDGDDFVDAIARMPAWQREQYARGR